MDIKKMERDLDKETKELIEISREVLRIARGMREKNPKPSEPKTLYEEAEKINPYISKYNTVSYLSC